MRALTPLIACMSATWLGACAEKSATAPATAPAAQSLAPPSWSGASAGLIDAKGAEVGRVVLRSAPTGVVMRIDIEGLAPGWHGVHFHAVGDCSDGEGGFKKAGAHYDPDNHDHGLLKADGAERGDLPNIHAGADGRATAEIFRSGVSLGPSEENAASIGPYPLIDDDGFAVVVHANADDQETQPIGGAGERVACAAVRP